jgi:hypothetical protein
MLLKTTSPLLLSNLAERAVEVGDSSCKLHKKILSQKILLLQAKSGNRCGHVPGRPRYYLRPKNHKPRLYILEEMLSKLKKSHSWLKKFLKRLRSLNAKNRGKRSERVEAIVSVSQVLVHYLEVVTLKVGFMTASGELVSLDINYIAGKAGVMVWTRPL